jgi:uncharacterized membrane protein
MSVSPSKSVIARRAEACGVLVAGANIPLTLQRTLMPRNSGDQALVTGLSISANQLVATFAYESVHALASRFGRSQTGWSSVGVDLGAFGGGVLAQRALRQRPDEPLARAAGRTAAFCVSVAGAAGAIVGALDVGLRLTERGRRYAVPAVLTATAVMAGAGELWRRRREQLDAGIETFDAPPNALRAVAFGFGVSAGMSALGAVERRAAERVANVAGRVLPGDATVWRPVAHAATLGALTAIGRVASQRAFGGIEAHQGAVETAFDIAPPSPMLSGAYESLVPYATLSLQGRRFVWMATPEDVLEKVTGDAATQPIRVYVGLQSADGETERVALALAELERTGAFERDWLMVVSPTGTGYVNYAAVSALEFLSRGNCATVAMQYAARPSVLSLRRVAEGRMQTKLLLAGIRERVQARPTGRRPRVVVFGESLGAWTSQDPFVGMGVQGLVDAGVDDAIWIGTPHFSKWKDEVLAQGDARVGVFHDVDEWRALDAPARARTRFVMITHHDDGVALFGPELAIQAPQWLGPPDTRPAPVPRGMRWVPTTTFFQVLVDMKNSANVVPGVFEAKGHDYRSDLLPFFDAVLGFDEGPEQLRAMGDWIEHRELQRTQWLAAHGDAGRSLSVAVLERLMERERTLGRDPDAALLKLVRDVAAAEHADG